MEENEMNIGEGVNTSKQTPTDKIMAKINDEVEKHHADDWWGKHNMTSRTVTLVSVVCLVFLTIYGCIKVPNEHFDNMFNTISGIVLYISLAIILGVNGLTKALDAIKSFKGK
jgi:hypothetical protein